MNESAFTYSVEVYQAGALLGNAPASVAPCIEDALFRGVLRGTFPNDGSVPEFDITPCWQESSPPVISGITLSNSGTQAETYDRGVFTVQAKALIQELVKKDRLLRDVEAQWQVVAIERKPEAQRPFRARLKRSPYPFHEGRLPSLAAGEFGIAIEPALLDDIRRSVIASPTAERAGLLLGDLVHDVERGAAALSIKSQLDVPAGRGGASRVHFALDAQTFSTAKKSLASSDSGCIPVGWWHSHPPCEDCPRNPSCQADTVFFSTDDVRVHASAFPSSYTVALVAGKVSSRPATEPDFRLYGWEEGRIAEKPIRTAGFGAGTPQRTATPG